MLHRGAIQATKLKELCRRTDKSHDKALCELKHEVLPHLPPPKGKPEAQDSHRESRNPENPLS